jgi:protein SCO1/2
MRWSLASVSATLLFAAACSREQTYQLVGQVVAVDPGRLEITIKHDTITGFMPGMTMPFKVKDARVLDGRKPGELVSATLTVSSRESHLTSIVHTGQARLAASKVADAPALEPGARAPDADFIDESGRHRRLSVWRGQMVALTFIYSRCPLPEFCPKMNRHFAAAQAAILDDRRLKGRVHLISVSLDPTFDTPSVLADLSRRAHADPTVWTFLTADERNIDLFGLPFGVYAVRDGKNLGNVTHNLRTAIIDGEGRVRKIFTGSDWTPADLIAALSAGE